jgi:ATP-dependent DNA helicase RecG
VKTALDILLKSGEGQFIEFKSCYEQLKKKPNRKRTLKSLARDVAIALAEFANADGGTLLLGVENDGTVSGAPLSEEEVVSVRAMARDSWKRAVPYADEILFHVNGRIVAFETDPQADVFSLTDGRTPYRNNDQTMWLSEEEVKALKRAKTSTLIERTLLPSATLEDLDRGLLELFRKNIGASGSMSTEDILTQYDLAVWNGSGVKLTLGACLLFGKPPMTRFHERCGINFRKFSGTVALTGARNNETKDETIEQPLPLLLVRTFSLVQGQIGVSRKLKDLFFEERPEYPTFAWQEAVVNAVAHRDYSLRGSEIEMRMFDDRLEVKNPGLPPDPVTLEELQQRIPVHASRNPRIMRVLKALKFVRERGEGLPRIFEETEESFLPLPQLVAEGRFFKIVLRNTPVFDEKTMDWLRDFPLERMNTRQRRVLAHTFQSGKGYFVLREYAALNQVDKEIAKKEIRDLVNSQIVEVVGTKKAAKYYPLLQRGTIEQRLKEYFSRHPSLSNTEYRRLAGNVHVVTASVQLRKLVTEGFLRKEGAKRGTRYYPTARLLKTK